MADYNGANLLLTDVNIDTGSPLLWLDPFSGYTRENKSPVYNHEPFLSST